MQIKQGIYEVACWLVQSNEISFEAINKLTVYNDGVAATFFIYISYVWFYVKI